MAEYEIEDWQTAYHAAKTQEEREQAIKDYEAAKLRNAARREEARFNSPTMIDKFMNGIKSLKKKMKKKRSNTKAKIVDQQKTR